MKEYDDILVAIHGIGDQSRNSTVRSVAVRLAHSSIAVGKPEDLPPISPQPLGWFYTDVCGAVKVAPLDLFDAPDHPLARTGFTEVFWADIPQEVVTEGRTLEETKGWARTVVARARAVYKKKGRVLDAARKTRALTAAEELQLIEPDFSLAAEVLEEVIETVYVLENLLFLAEKAGLAKFDLKKVLDEYLGDVQIITEFTLFRRDVIGRFHSAMQQIHHDYPKADLHIVAHSEGTVVSFLGLLHALSGERCLSANAAGGATIQNEKRTPDWLRKVRGFMTIGSPIDKHILIWPHLFADFDFKPAEEIYKKCAPIKWRNYYDYGDPVGFKLETARAWLDRQPECRPFEFEPKHDFGFSRYILPGKAHNDYWEDRTVFEHFIQDVVKPKEDLVAKKPEDRWFVPFLSTAGPYFLSFLLLFVATFILYRAAATYTHPAVEPLQRYLRFTVLGLSEVPGLTPPEMLLHALGIAGLLAGVTLLARLPRLATGWRWFGWGLVAFAVGAVCYLLVGEESRSEIGYIFRDWGNRGATAGVLLLAFSVGVISLVTVMPSHEFGRAHKRARKQRWFRKGMRPLILFGALAILILIVAQILPHSALTDDERSKLAKAKEERIQSPLLAAKLSRADLELDEAKAIDGAHLNRLDLNVLLWPNGEFRDPGPAAIKTVTQVLAARPPVWPVLLSGAIFLYLWWLAALIFDLGFVWHRYIRHSLATDRLMLWSDIKKEPKPVPPASPAAA